jgi:hypothetical protein
MNPRRIRFSSRGRRALTALGLSLAGFAGLACNAALNLDRFERDLVDAGNAPEAQTPSTAPETSTGPEAGTAPEVSTSAEASTSPGDGGFEAAAPMPMPTPAGRVGNPCSTDADCAGALSLSCFDSGVADFPGIIATGASERHRGGPAGGYCSRTCLGDGDCGSAARCLVHETGARVCFATCDLQALAPQCESAAPQACVPVSNPDGGACYPLCTKDADCGAGRLCDAASGLCGDGLVRGSGGIGAACNVATETSDCSSGLCWNPEGTGVGVCTALCRAGAGGCGTGADLSASATACLSDHTSPGAIGSCMRLCDADTDCESDYVCLPDPPVVGRRGSCGPRSFLGPAPAPPMAGQ